MFFKRKLKRMTYNQLIEDAKNNNLKNWNILYSYSKKESIDDILKFDALCKQIIKTSPLPKYDSKFGNKLIYNINSYLLKDAQYNTQTGNILKGTPIISIYEMNNILKIVDKIEWPFRLFE